METLRIYMDKITNICGYSSIIDQPLLHMQPLGSLFAHQQHKVQLCRVTVDLFHASEISLQIGSTKCSCVESDIPRLI
jgi:hypothetical protein